MILVFKTNIQRKDPYERKIMNTRFKKMNGLLVVTFLFFASTLNAQFVSEQLVSIPEKFRPIKLRSALPAAKVQITGLKAVLIGAPIDGDDGSWTTSEIKNLKMTAKTLRERGVTVYEFYTPSNSWTAIKEACNGAHFLMYRGHGVYDGNNPPKWVGGFSLKDYFASSENIKKDLKLAQGSIVMIYGCFTAGNSGFDIGKIDENEASRRVNIYAKPFMEMGVSGYYANWYGDAFQHFTAHLFSGKTLGESFKAYDDYNQETTSQYTISNSSAVLWLDHDDWDGKIAYNNAFVGYSEKRLTDLFSDQENSTGLSGTKTDESGKVTNGAGGQVKSSSSFVSMIYLSDLEKQVVRELNAVRSNPSGYAVFAKEVLQLFKGDLLQYPGEISIRTNEGKEAVQECYEFLMAAVPIDTLRPSRGMSLAAKDHVEDQGETESTGHTGNDGSSPFDRIERYGQWQSTAGENIDYGNNIARRIVLSLLIDDGVASRGHRKNIFNPAFKVVGVACGPHKMYRHMCVMTLSGGFKSKKDGSSQRGIDSEEE